MSNMVVRTNIFALNAHRNMKNVGLEQARASNRLSSGFRINSAADDAAGLAISETMRAQIRGLDQASRNAQDGQAMLLTTEGGLEEIGNMLQRVRELLVQASNDTNTQNQREMIEQEIAQLGEEIQGMQARVEFNTNQVLNIGTHDNIQNAIAVAQATFAVAQASGGAAGGAHGVAMASASGTLETGTEAANSALGTALASAAGTFANSMATADTQAQRDAALAVRQGAEAAAQGTFQIAMNTANNSFAVASASANGTFDIAMGTLEAAQHAFIAQVASQFAAVSDSLDDNGVAWFQVGANSGQSIQFDFATVSQAVLVAGHLVNGIASALVMTGTSGQSGIGFGEGVSPMIDAVNSGLDAINSVRANLGAVQNRMDFTMRSLDISSENLQDSESRVRNADIAREMMRFTMSNVLQQAAVSMLSQANQLPNNLLQLLR